MRSINLLFILISFSTFAQELTRRASWDASLKLLNDQPGLKVEAIEKNSPMAKAGVQVGDIILKVNHQLINSDETWTEAFYGLRGNSATELLVKRGVNVFSAKVTFNEIPLEKHPNLETYYESLMSDYGIRQRVIITRPKNVSGKQPAIILIQGLSCSTIELYPGRDNNWARQIKDLVEQSGMVVMRIEKPGVGDSEGDCSKTDFYTELNGYKNAIQYLKQKDFVDSTRIVVYGSSMGSALAPYLANEFNLAGVISDGTFFKTWFEHMLEIERRIRKMSGDDESTIVKKMNEGFIPLYYGMLIEQKSYQEIIAENPALKDYNYHSPEHMYGRPVEYYQQVQKFDLGGEWEKLRAPLRIMYGSNDWIMSEYDNHMIMDVLDRAGHEDHQLLIYPGLDHWNTIHQSPDDSYHRNPGVWDPKVPQTIIDWAKEMVD